MPEKQRLEELRTNITGLRQRFVTFLDEADPGQSWDYLDAIDFLDNWEEDINAQLAVLELNESSRLGMIKNWFKGDK